MDAPVPRRRCRGIHARASVRPRGARRATGGRGAADGLRRRRGHAGGHGRRRERLGPAFVALAGLYAIAGLVEFEVGTIRTDCSLAALAAMLVALPPALIPWCAAAGPRSASRQDRPRDAARLALVPAVAQVSLPVLAPATVLALLAPVSSWTDLPVIAVALAAYVAADLIGSSVFAWMAYGDGPGTPVVRGHVGSTPSICCWRRSVSRWRSPPAGDEWALASCSCRSRCCCASSPRSAERGSTRRSSSRRPIAAPRCCSATSSRPTTPTPVRTAAT